MYIINPAKLIKGDIILSKYDDELSKRIRLKTNSEYSHCSIYISDFSIIEATSEGVHSQNIQRLLFNNKDDAVAFRFNGLSKDQIDKIDDYIRKSIGTEYGIREALKTLKGNENRIVKNRQFCTRLIAQAYRYAGINIVNNADFCTTKEIENSSLLKVQNDILKIASAEEKEFARNNEKIQFQIDATNRLLKSARDIFKIDIQDLNMINIELIKQPRFDVEINEALKKSGYLDIWKLEHDANAHYYNYDLFCKKYIDINERKFIANALYKVEMSNKNRHFKNYNAIKSLSDNFNFLYFKTLTQLYLDLCNEADTKIETMIKVINLTPAST
jgi:rcorf112